MANETMRGFWKPYTANITKEPYKAYIYMNGKFIKVKPMICVGQVPLTSNIADIAIANKAIAG